MKKAAANRSFHGGILVSCESNMNGNIHLMQPSFSPNQHFTDHDQLHLSPGLASSLLSNSKKQVIPEITNKGYGPLLCDPGAAPAWFLGTGFGIRL